jgi:SAM-dependent methyltransferase
MSATPVLPAGREGKDARLDALLPEELRPLIDDRFATSCGLFEEYVRRRAIEVVRDTGLEAAAREAGTAGEIAARAGLDADRGRVPVAWLFGTLEDAGLATGDDRGRYGLDGPLPRLEPGEMAEAQVLHDPACLPSYRLADLAAAAYPKVLRGLTSGEQALFGPETIAAWFDYFSNDNPIYAVSNRIGAVAAAKALAAAQGVTILELGGGLGSATAALLERLGGKGSRGEVPGAPLASYRFTEVAPSFLRRGQRNLTARFPGAPLSFGQLDMDRPFAEAGIEKESCALVYGVNTLHVARDLEFTLAEVRRALAPGGALVISECVRPFAGRPVYVEFLFNLLESFQAPILVEPWRPHGGFLAPEQWTAALEACGFREVAVTPPIGRIREICPQFVVAAIAAVRA